MVPEKLLEITEYLGEGYQPLVDYGEWRVAVLRFIDELLPDRLNQMEKHNETDEVFVLLAGKCILFFGEGEDSVEEVYAEEMQLLKLYNVRKGAFHTHTLSEDAVILIVENRDTTEANSSYVQLTKQQQEKIMALTEKIWK